MSVFKQFLPAVPPVMLTPPPGQPGGWPKPPPPTLWAPGYPSAAAPPNPGTQAQPLGGSEPGSENYRKMFEQKSREYQQLLVQMNSMKEEVSAGI